MSQKTFFQKREWYLLYLAMPPSFCIKWSLSFSPWPSAVLQLGWNTQIMSSKIWYHDMIWFKDMISWYHIFKDSLTFDCKFLIFPVLLKDFLQWAHMKSRRGRRMAGSGLENCLLFTNTGKNEYTLYLQTQKHVGVCTVSPLQHFLTSLKIAISCWCMLM